MKSKILLGSALLGLILACSASATKITAIKYVGCERIEQETISSYFPIQVGDECDDETINEALKTLKETNFFSDVRVKMSGSTIIVEVTESPIINKVSFEGNSKISDRDIKTAIKLGSHEVLSPAKVREIQQSLLAEYRKLGRYNASVNPKIIKLKDNRVNLVFEINEGVAAGISKIIFVGNNKISSSELRDIIYSKVKRWYRFFVTDDIYDADRMDEDKQAITKFYHEQGYINARVLSAVAELSTNKSSFVLTFTIDEGEQYSFDSVAVKSRVAKISDDGLSKDLLCRKGDMYRESFVEADSAGIARTLGKRGFSTIKVTPQISKNSTNKTVNVTFNINEGEKVYISKIVISGNTKTRDNIIRREIILEEGDAYNQSFVKMAENRLKDLGFFQKVDVQAIPDPNSPDKCILHVSVEEAPTAEAMASASYSTTSGLGVDLSYNEKNFFGTGKSLSVFLGSSRSISGKSRIINADGSKGTTSQKEKFRFLNNVQFSVSDPHIFDKDMEGSLSGHRYVTSIFDGFNVNEVGCGFGVDYVLGSHFSQGWSYTLDHRKFQNVDKRTSPIILSQIQRRDGNTLSTQSDKNILSAISHTIRYSTYFIRGLRGSLSMSLTTTAAGMLGGDARHLKNEFVGTYVIPAFRRSSLSATFSMGILTKLGGREPNVVDSFILGMDSFRGFEYAGVGPLSSTVREVTTGTAPNQKIGHPSRRDFVGAKKYWKGTLEYTFPLGLPEELQFRGFVFTDFGTLWGVPNKTSKYLKTEAGTVSDQAGLEHPKLSFPYFDEANDKVVGLRIFDNKKVRQSVGFGVSFVTPFGPMKLTYAIPVRKGKYDETQRFIFGFSSSF